MAIDSLNEQCYSNNVEVIPTSKPRTVSFNDTKQQSATMSSNGDLNRAGNVFDSIDRRGESDRKVPRQARPVISRKDVEKSGSGRNTTVTVAASPIVSATICENSEFRTRAQTAPVNSLKRRKDRERATANVIDNNNDESLDEGNVANVESFKQNEKKQSKYRFAFKKNLAKENGPKEEVSLGKAINRRLKGKEGTVTPNREILASSAPGQVDDPADLQKLRTRSASASSNSERRRRTRRRRGRKSGTVDNEISDLSFEDALHFVHQDQMENQEEFPYREGQTWTEDGIGCEMSIVGGTTYFTPIPANNPDRSELSDERAKEASPLTENKTKNESLWSPVDGSGDAYQEGPMFSMKVESYEEFHPKANRITQSAPMGGRTVKQETRHIGIEDLRENLKVIWSKTEKKLKPEDEMKLAESDKLSSETALAAISIDDGSSSRSVDPAHISKIWEMDRLGSTATLPIKTKSVWEPRPAEQNSFQKSFERSRDNSPTWNDGIWGKESNNSVNRYHNESIMDMSALRLTERLFDPLPQTQYPPMSHQLTHHHLNSGSSSDPWPDSGHIWGSEITMAHAK